MTVEDFADILGRGEYDSGKPYGPNKDGVIGWCAGVRLGKEYFQYTVYDRISLVEPKEVIEAIRFASDIKQRDNGKQFDATIWSDGRCYMLFHKRKVVA
jgi:hypothetical protein